MVPLMSIIVVIVVAAGHMPLVSTTDWTATMAAKIDEAAEAIHDCVQYPGLTVAVVVTGGGGDQPDDTDRSLVRNYGIRDVSIGTEKPVDDSTRFCIGSVTKTFTAALLAQLVHDNGTYSLDTSVKDILGSDFELCDDERTYNTSIRDLLAHRVGVAKHFGAFLLGYNFTRANIVRRVRHLPAARPFRQSRVFNNFMYVIAGQLAEKLNGTWWETQVTARFLDRLQMKRTTFADRVSDWGHEFAIPHALDNGKAMPLRAKVTGNVLRPVGPAASICTTSSDVTSWILMLLRNGTDRRGQQVLSPQVIQELFKVHNPFGATTSRRADNDFMAAGYGLGWMMGTYRNRRRAFHSGFSNYYHSMISLLPDVGIGIYTALNGPHLVRCDNGMKALHLYITDLLTNETPWLNPANLCQYPRFPIDNDNDNVSLTTPPPPVFDNATIPPEDHVVQSESISVGIPSNSTGNKTPSSLRSRLRTRVKSRRRRPTRGAVVTKNSKILPYLQPFLGTYTNPFFGDVVINVNLSAPALQFNYGYYGKALLEPVSTAGEHIVFRTHFFSSIWHQSESDDMKLFAKLGMLDVQFGAIHGQDIIDTLVVFLFDTQTPPIFTRISSG